jgi:cob(I)alamin adenosyltransferase
MKIYTRRGDQGETGLLGGSRVRKDHPRIAAFGDVDELNAVIGWARSTAIPREIDRLLERIQHELFALGAELATEQPQPSAKDWISPDLITALEQDIDHWQERLPSLRNFILPGGVPAAAALHVARCVARRAERRVVELAAHDARLRPVVIAYLNRLSDLLFVLARAVNHLAGASESLWHPPRAGIDQDGTP